MIAIVTNDLQYAAANKHKERKSSYEKVSENIENLLKSGRKLNTPIIHLLLTVEDGDKRSVGKEPEKTFIRGSTGHKVLESVYEKTDLLIEKPKDSGFFETSLDETLKKLGVESIVLVGMQTQICIQTTAADAHFRGYDVYVPRDCVCSTREEDTQAALVWLEKYGSKLTDSTSLLKLFEDNALATA